MAMRRLHYALPLACHFGPQVWPWFLPKAGAWTHQLLTSEKKPRLGPSGALPEHFGFALIASSGGETNGMRRPLINHRVETFITKDRA